MRKYKFYFLFLILCFAPPFGGRGTAQESQTTYNFLRVPVSAHAAALGGDNITIPDDDASLIFSNPALLSNISSKTIGLNYMNYLRGCNTLSASYVMDVLDRGKVAVSAQYMDYGKMKEMTSEGVETGSFSAKDIAFAGYFSYLLNDYFSAGITAKFITSYISRYSSMGVGVDLGINYYNEKHEWSASAVVKNLGGQVKAYTDNFEKLPIDLQLGVSKRFVGSPVRINLMMSNLNHWKNVNFIQHWGAGVDLLFNRIWVGIGYNFRRASDMKYGDSGEKASTHAAGLSLGAGINLEKFKINFSWSKYHTASSALQVNLAYTL